MKLSKYTFVVKKDDCPVLYNCRTEQLTVLDPSLADLLRERSLYDISVLHPTFYAHLVEGRFAVPDDEDEAASVVADWQRSDTDPRQFAIFINPTLDCNLRCWYCYEKHHAGSRLTGEVYDAVVHLIRRKVVDPQLEQLVLSFFGGEPLLTFDDVILPLLAEADRLCHEYGKMLVYSFVTNATLLTDHVVERLLSVRSATPPTFQITLDGNAASHDRVRIDAEGHGSYAAILAHIKRVLRAGMGVTLRLNTTNANLDTFVDVLTDLADLSDAEKQLVTVDIQHVWQDVPNRTPDFAERQERLRDHFREVGFTVTELKHIDTSRCYADKDNHISVNYNGDLYKCTARDFTPDNREGQLEVDGALTWNDKRTLRDRIKYGNETCRACRLFPLCHGGCSQFKLDSIGRPGCIRGYSPAFRQKIIEDRIDYLLEKLTSN